jgi:acetyl esterase/lipase
MDLRVCSKKVTRHGLFSLITIFLCVLPGTLLVAQDSDKTPHKTTATREDWTSLTLTGSDLKAAKPLLGEKTENAFFTRELIQVEWRAGDPIDLYIIRPKSPAKPPVILYLYGYPTENDRFRDDDYCDRITRGGFAAVGFVSALTGHRYHDRPMRKWFVSELQESLSSSVHDVQMILNYLASRNDLDMDKVGMFGAGSGGSIAILAAAADQRIKAVDVLDAWGDWPDWLAQSQIIPDEERRNYVTPEFLKKVEPLDPLRWLPKLASRQVRIEHVLDDGDTPKVAKDKIESAAPSGTQIVRYEDTPSFYHAVSAGRLFQWTKDQLHPASQAVAEKKVQPSEAGTHAKPASNDD